MAEFNMAAALEKQLASRKTTLRTIDTVTAEILDLNQQAGDTIIAIGQRLIEAKGMLSHGEWLPWLTERVNYSERSAQNFMKLARAYEGNPQLVADLGISRAMSLLALPEGEREQFLAEAHDVDGKTKPAADLSKREFEKAVKQRERKPVLHKNPASRRDEVCTTGQMVIAAWMPGGANPGRESGLCVCMMPLNPLGDPVPKILRWEGVLGRWEFPNGEPISLEPVGWMRLPEWKT